MFGFEEQDSIKSWLDNFDKRRPMHIDCDNVKNTLNNEISRLLQQQKDIIIKIEKIRKLLKDEEYFKQ